MQPYQPSLADGRLVVLLEGRDVLTGLLELLLLHALTKVPVDEGLLGVHHVELLVHADEDLRNGRGVGNHADGTGNLGQVVAGNDARRLVVDAELEASGRPVDEAHGLLGLHVADGGVDVLGHDVAAVHEAAGHVVSETGVALGHHRGGVEGGVGDLSHRHVLVLGLAGADDGRVRGKHEVDAGVGHQVGLEFVHVDVQRAVEAQGGGQGRNDLRDDAVQVLVDRAADVEVLLADGVNGLVVEDDGDVGVLQEGVRRQDGVVGLHYRRGHLGRRPDAEVELGLALVLGADVLQEETAGAGAGTAANCGEEEEALDAVAGVAQLADAVHGGVHDVGAGGVAAAGEVVRRVLLARHQLLRVEQVLVRASAHFVDDGGLEVHKEAPGDLKTDVKYETAV
ncbi:uncharacterized protein BcabD6B2_57190 [Babesia caballi]|uniref:Uncharacterized protein n=1 Tax=Babesia caballi TaxID=5871 RepID=A0AAV4M1N5_BABCB|nr:hypothetical protein, conserved [Babesia caballi]